MSSRPLTPELEDLADQIGEFLHLWGFKKVHGRIWTHLLLSRIPLDAGELIERLEISKALASLTLNEMLDYRVIQEAGRSDRGTVTYGVNQDVLGVIRNVLRSRERRLISRISAAHRLLRRLPPSDLKTMDLDRDRVMALGKLIATAGRGLDGFLLRYRFDLGVARRLSLKP